MTESAPSEPGRIRTYDAFWPYYLREHAKPATRLWHIAGTAIASGLLLAALVSFSLPLFLAAVLAGYGPAWMAHAVVEKNQPATLRYPLWSLISDFRMAGQWLSGRLERELQRAGIRQNRFSG